MTGFLNVSSPMFPVTKADIRKMGVGGLLMEIISRPQPRAADAEPVAPEVALSSCWQRPLFAHGQQQIAAGLEGQADPAPYGRGSAAKPARWPGHRRYRPSGGEAEAALAGLDLRFVHNPAFAEGLASPSKAGVAAVPAGAEGVIVMLGDMPRVSGSMLDRLILTLAAHPEAMAVAPNVAGQRGNPVLIARAGMPLWRG